MGSYQTLYSKHEEEYERLWGSLEINPDKVNIVNETVDAIAANRSRYKTVEAATSVPWYVVGIIHSLEGDLSFSTHLHNGDSLRRRTVNEPSGRPEEGDPPFSWEESAIDALKMILNEEKKWSDPPNWTISSILFKLELYNGWGYQGKINTPYLWSFTNQYESGKFVSDGSFSTDAVSEQCGAAALIAMMIERKIIVKQEIVYYI